MPRIKTVPPHDKDRMHTPEDFGDRIREHLGGTPVRELARQSGVDNAQLVRLMKGYLRSLEWDRLVAVARVLGVQPVWLLGRSDVAK